MAITFTLAGVDRTALVRIDTLSITDQLNSRSTAAFELVDRTGAYMPAAGDEIVVLNNGVKIFAGSVDELEAGPPSERGIGLEFSVTCVDYSQVADRRYVARAYETPGQTLADIVTDIVASDLAGEGISAAGVDTGPVIEKAVWNYQTVAEAFGELADLAGMAWWVDYDKVLHFRVREAIVAPWGLANTSANFRALRAKRTRTDYRNRQIVRAGVDLTASRTEGFKGDGQTRAFTLQYPVGARPTALTVNGVAKTLGIGGVDKGFDFYWNKGNPILKQDDGKPILTTADVGSVTYQGEVPIIVIAQSDLELAAREAAETGTGIYEQVEAYPNVNSEMQARQIADGLLKKFGRIPTVVTYETDVDGLAAGQLQPIVNTALGLSGDYLISDVRFGAFAGGRKLRYQVTALDGQHLGGWEKFFRDLAQAGRQYVIRENEVIVQMRTATEAVVAGDALAADGPSVLAAATASEVIAQALKTPESRVGFALVNQSEVG